MKGHNNENHRTQNLVAGTAFAQSTRWDELSKLAFKESYPTPEASARLYDEMQFQRAVQVYLWALPAMNMVAMRDGQAATFGGGSNVLAVFKDRPNAKTIILTANPDVIYGLAFVDLKEPDCGTGVTPASHLARTILPSTPVSTRACNCSNDSPAGGATVSKLAIHSLST